MFCNYRFISFKWESISIVNFFCCPTMDLGLKTNGCIYFSNFAFHNSPEHFYDPEISHMYLNQKLFYIIQQFL